MSGSSLNLGLHRVQKCALFINILRPSSSASQITVCVQPHNCTLLVGDDEELSRLVILVAPVINQQSSDALFSKQSPFENIGNLLEITKSIDTICQLVSNLSYNAKHSLLCCHIAPPNILLIMCSHLSSRWPQVRWYLLWIMLTLSF